MSTSHDSETPAHGQQVITACAFIHGEFSGQTKLFWPKRAATKKFLPGVFELPGGHIDYGEEIVVGLKREIREEFGLDIRVGDPFAAFSYTNEIKGSHSIEVVYFATFISTPEKIALDPADHSEYRWVTLAEATALIAGTEREDDHEWRIIQRGFALLAGSKPNFGDNHGA